MILIKNKDHHILSFQKTENYFFEISNAISIKKIFQCAKASLDLGYQVIICEVSTSDFDIKFLASKHFYLDEKKYLYLNKSYKNKIRDCFTLENEINNFQELVAQVKKLSIFSE